MLLNLVILTILCGSVTASTERWSSAALSWLQADSCSRCLQSKDQMRLYVAEPTHLGKMRAIVADGSARHSGVHDGVLVIDPKPHLRFGHQLFMFFIDRNYTRARCEAAHGVLLDGGDCLEMWRRGRCNRRLPSQRNSGCQLLYVPEVRLATGGGDRLMCRSGHGFLGSCPRQRFEQQTVCDPLATNSKACDTTNYLKTQCNFMQSCDHAVLVAGGWNQQHINDETIKNLQRINRMLHRNGFLSRDIKTFFANGFSESEEVKYSDLGDVYPSGLKLALRYHLLTICGTARCADSLVIYMNSPTRPDGAALLWDMDGNGEMDETEVYSVRQIMADIKGCKARRVILLADQAYSSELVSFAMRQSDDYDNLVILGVSSGDSKDSLVSLLVKQEASTCLSELVHSGSVVKFIGSGAGLTNATLSGAPCSPENEVNMEKYFGCQNLSTLEILEPDDVPQGNEDR